MQSIHLTYAAPDDPPWKRLLIRGVEWISGRHQLDKLCNRALEDSSPMAEKWSQVLSHLHIEVSIDRYRLSQRLQTANPVIVIANHPFGVLDGVILIDILASLREDYFMMVNSVLCRDPRISPYFLPIDSGKTKNAVKINLSTRREAIKRLRSGGALGIFPAGSVATAPMGWGRAREREWKLFVAKLIQLTQATVIPLYFEGQNSRLFQIVSQFNRPLRLALLLREVLNKSGQSIKVHCGDPLPPEGFTGMRRTDLIHHLWRVTHALGGIEDTMPGTHDR